MECFCYLRNVHDKMADGQKFVTDHQFLLEHRLSASQLARKTSQEFIRLDEKKKTLKGIFQDNVLRSGGGWSGDLMIADSEDLQESGTSEIHVKRFQSQEVFVKGEYEFP